MIPTRRMTALLAVAALPALTATGGLAASAPGSPAPGAESPTLIASDEQGRILEVSPETGAVEAVLATADTTGGPVPELARSAAGGVFFATHDPLVGLPCDSTVRHIDDEGHVDWVGPGFGPATSPDGGRVAYVHTEASSERFCDYSVAVTGGTGGDDQRWRLGPRWQGIGICSVAWDPTGNALAATLCYEAESIVKVLDPGRSGVIDDAPRLGPADPTVSWAAAGAGRDEGEMVVVEMCCSDRWLDLQASLRFVHAEGGERAPVPLDGLGGDLASVDSVATLTGSEGGDRVFVTARTIDGDGVLGTSRLYRIDEGGPVPLADNILAVAA